MRRRLGYAAFGLLCTLAPTAILADTDVYDIELVLFSQTAPSDEHWPEQADAPDRRRARQTLYVDPAVLAAEAPRPAIPLAESSAPPPLASGARPSPAEQQPLPPGPDAAPLPPVELLPESALNLRPQAYSLQRQGYQIMLHLGWRQVVGELGSDPWYWLETPGLAGLIKIEKGRYLHIGTEWLIQDESIPYRLDLGRRMRSEELHYLDHPRAGLLVQILPVESDTLAQSGSRPRP